MHSQTAGVLSSMLEVRLDSESRSASRDHHDDLSRGPPAEIVSFPTESKELNSKITCRDQRCIINDAEVHAAAQFVGSTAQSHLRPRQRLCCLQSCASLTAARSVTRFL